MSPGQAAALDGRLINKFGHSPAIGTTEREIWDGGDADYTGFITVPAPVRIKVGGNAADTADGAGAREIQVQGLDGSGVLATELIVTAGASASSPTATSFSRIFRAFVTQSGTYHTSNTAAIEIETTNAETMAIIVAGEGQTQMAIYSVPLGFKAQLVGYRLIPNDTKNAAFKLFQCPNILDVAAPFTGAKRVAYEWDDVTVPIVVGHFEGPVFDELTDVWITGKMALGAAEVFSAHFDLCLIPKVDA